MQQTLLLLILFVVEATVFLCCTHKHVHNFISNFFIYRFFLKKNSVWHKNLSNYFNTAATKKRARCGGFQCRMGSLVGRPQRPSVHSLPGRAEDGDGVFSTMKTENSKWTRAKKLRKWSKGFYLSKPLSHFWRGSIPIFTITQLGDYRRP